MSRKICSTKAQIVNEHGLPEEVQRCLYRKTHLGKYVALYIRKGGGMDWLGQDANNSTLVKLTLLDEMNDYNICEANSKTLETALGIDSGNIRRVLSKLKKRGEVKQGKKNKVLMVNPWIATKTDENVQNGNPTKVEIITLWENFEEWDEDEILDLVGKKQQVASEKLKAEAYIREMNRIEEKRA